MTTTSSLRSCSAFDCVLLMTNSLLRNLRGESLEDLSKHAVERGKRVDDVGKRLERSRELYSQHELAKDLAGTWRDERRTNQHAALAVGDQLHRAAVKVVGVAARGLRGIGGGDRDVDALGARGSLR